MAAACRGFGHALYQIRPKIINCNLDREHRRRDPEHPSLMAQIRQKGGENDAEDGLREPRAASRLMEGLLSLEPAAPKFVELAVLLAPGHELAMPSSLHDPT